MVSRRFLLVFLLWGLAAPAQAAVLGLQGQPLPHRTYRRIVSLAPSVTELLFAIGWGSKLVATTEHSDFPAEARKLPQVGGAESLNVERMVALHPDLILSIENRAPAIAQASRLTGAPVGVLESPTLESIALNAESLGEVLGPEGHAFAMKFRQDLRAVKPASRPVRVFFLAWDRPLMTVGPGSFLHDMLVRAGGENVVLSVPARHAGATRGYPLFSEEQLIASHPEVVFYPSNLQAAAMRLRAHLKTPRYVALDADDVSRPGPRILRALRLTVKSLNFR